jgi:ABC-type amino acid transport substrate-binding protein
MRWIFCCLMLLGAALPAAAQDDAPLRVLLRVAPPFVIEESGGRFSGLSFELWREIADELELEYEVRTVGLSEMLEEIAAGRADVGVGATTMTAEREAVLDFTHPFLSSGLAIVARSGDPAWAGALKRLFSTEFVRAAGALALLLLVVGFLVWVFEHRANPQQFENDARRGLWSSFWFAAVSMTTVGYGDKTPVSVGGRIVALVWMFASIIVISFFTAALATALTVQTLEAGIGGPEDLPRVTVGAVANTTSAQWLEAREISPRTFESPQDGLQALEAGEITAFVHDAPIVRWLIQRRGAGELIVLPRVVERQDYALLLPPDSPLREDINRVLLQEVRRERFAAKLREYLGQ